MKITKLLLLPFALLYGIGVAIRNLMFDWGIFRSTQFDFPIIGVGNLSVGGTGKTPTTEYLVNFFLNHNIKPGVLSRGYGRQTRGYYLLDKKATAENAGDEPYQVYKKFPEAAVAVCADRVEGVGRMLHEVPDLQVIILDDAFQHRAIKPGLNLLLTDYTRPFTQRFLLPAGHLREWPSASKRADAIILSKGPKVLSPLEERRLKDDISPEPHQRLFFSYLRYSDAKSAAKPVQDLSRAELKNQSVVLFTGIANPMPLKYFIEQRSREVLHLNYEDHHRFRNSDIEKIIRTYKDIPRQQKIILTTEKDLRRLENSAPYKLFNGLPLYFLPVKARFHQTPKNDFDQYVLNFVREKLKQYYAPPED